MALYMVMLKNRGVLKNLEVDRKLQIDEELIQNEEDAVLKTELNQINQGLLETEKLTITETEGVQKKFWMNLVGPSEPEIIEKLKYRIKLLETLIALCCLGSLILTQFEYEIEYYEKMYVVPGSPWYPNTGEAFYNGNGVRIIVSAICCFLIVVDIISNYMSYILKREQKKILNSKNIL